MIPKADMSTSKFSLHKFHPMSRSHVSSHQNRPVPPFLWTMMVKQTNGAPQSDKVSGSKRIGKLNEARLLLLQRDDLPVSSCSSCTRTRSVQECFQLWNACMFLSFQLFNIHSIKIQINYDCFILIFHANFTV